MPIDTAVVTGASGYIASEIIAQLLHKGYTVRATVRNASDQGRIEHLKKLAEAFSGELSFHEAQLGEIGAFNDVVRGASYVFHCAAEIALATFPSDAEGRLKVVERAVESQLDIIRAAAASKNTVKRVVITSSVAAVKPFDAIRVGKPWNEEDWNMASLDKEKLVNDTYYGLKTLTELKSYELAKELGVSLSSIVPSFVAGPIISGNMGFTPTLVKAWLEGDGDDAVWMATAVDVRDVARAHILAAEKRNGEGRFLVARSHPLPPSEMVTALRNILPEYIIDEEDRAKRGYYNPDFQIYDTSKVKALGVQFTDICESIVDMIVSMLKKGMIKLELIEKEEEPAGMAPLGSRKSSRLVVVDDGNDSNSVLGPRTSSIEFRALADS